MVSIDPTISTTVIYASLFATLCLGLTLTYLTTKVPNFAHTDFTTLGFYTTFTLYWLAGMETYATIPFSFVAGGVFAVVMYVAILRPLSRRGSGIVPQMIATLAVDIAFVGIIGAYTDYLNAKYLALLGPAGFNPYTVFAFHDISILGLGQSIVIIAPVAAALVGFGLYILLTRTRFGVAMRASIENPSLAKIVGINVERVYVVSWFIAGGIAGMSGTLWGVAFGGTTDLSRLLIVAVFAGSILGGLTNLYGAIVGGLIVGASENFLTTWLTQVVGYQFGSITGSGVLAFQRGIPLAIMIVTLMFIPQGVVSADWGRARKSVAVKAAALVGAAFMFGLAAVFESEVGFGLITNGAIALGVVSLLFLVGLTIPWRRGR
jgi:branched-chain amino acid transport system permease protein